MQTEALKSEQKEIFKELKRFPEFYLAGGTALALQMGHRISVDFDLFCGNDLPSNFLVKVRRVFKGYPIEVIFRHSEQISVTVNDIKIDFVKYRYPLVLELAEFRGVKLAKPAEIVTMKAFALNYREMTKDYFDIYFALKDKYTTLQEIEEIGEKKYHYDFNFRLFLEQLLLLEGLKEERITFFRQAPTKEEMRDFFKKQIAKVKI